MGDINAFTLVSVPDHVFERFSLYGPDEKTETDHRLFFSRKLVYAKLLRELGNSQ